MIFLDKYEHAFSMINNFLKTEKVTDNDSICSFYTLNQLLHEQFDLFYGAFNDVPTFSNNVDLNKIIRDAWWDSSFVNKSGYEKIRQSYRPFKIIPYYNSDYYELCILAGRMFRYRFFLDRNSSFYYYNTEFIHDLYNKKVEIYNYSEQKELGKFYNKMGPYIDDFFQLMRACERYSPYLKCVGDISSVDFSFSREDFSGNIKLDSTGKVSHQLFFSNYDEDFIHASWSNSRRPLQELLNNNYNNIMKRIPIEVSDLPKAFIMVYQNRNSFDKDTRGKEYFIHK